jgi:hypothetical protein
MPNLLALAIPAFIVLMAIEAIANALMRRDLYEIKDAAAMITLGLGNAAVNLVAKTLQTRQLRRFVPIPDLSSGLPVVGMGAGVLCRRVPLLLVPPCEPRAPAVLGVARGASLVAAL